MGDEHAMKLDMAKHDALKSQRHTQLELDHTKKSLENDVHRLEGKLLAALAKEVDAGNVSAMDKLFKRLDRQDLATGATSQPTRQAKPPKKGKKEAAVEAAHTAHEGSPWGNLLRH